ncbi:MAG: hypothetical protein O7H41_11610 [Planctomycetota bacterium]|nr:hypothetical protein [Planctomycetota bacterium]
MTGREAPILRAALLLLASCAGPTPKPPSYPRTTTVDEAVQIIRKRTEGLEGMHARLTIETERGILRGYLWADRSGRLRIHARRLVWSALDLLIDGDHVVLHLPRRWKALKASLAEMGSRAGPLLASRDLLRALLGDGGDRRASFTKDPDSLILSQGSAGQRREVWTYDRDHLLLRLLTRHSADGELELEVSVGDYSLFDGRWWPASAALKTSDKEMGITLESIEENPEMSADVFRIDLPEDTEIVHRLDELDE